MNCGGGWWNVWNEPLTLGQVVFFLAALAIFYNLRFKARSAHARAGRLHTSRGGARHRVEPASNGVVVSSQPDSWSRTKAGLVRVGPDPLTRPDEGSVRTPGPDSVRVPTSCRGCREIAWWSTIPRGPVVVVLLVDTGRSTKSTSWWYDL